MRWEELRGGAVDIEVEAHLRQIVESGKQLRVKLGIDPSAPDLHLGHTVVLRKMRQFQEAGHTAVLIIGDFTARIGDPSGRSETRKPLTELEVEENGETYLQQFSRVMDRERTEVRRQSEWFGGMDLSEVIRLAGRSTVARLLQREDFTQRVEAVERELAAGSNPRDAKALLASEVVRMYHGAHAAAEAEEGFVRQFREGGAPDQMEEVFLPAGVEGGSVATTLMVTALASSKNEARRLVAQRGVRLNGRTV